MGTGTSRFTGVISHVAVLVFTLVLLSGAAVLGNSGAAAADANQDDQFLALLAQEGIPAIEGVPSLVDTAHKVCRALGAGVPANRVRDALVDFAVANDPAERQYGVGRIVRTQARFIIASVGAYCPWERSTLGSLIVNRPSGFLRPATAAASYSGTTAPEGITEPNPPQIPAPQPPIAHLQPPPEPIAIPPRPQQPLPRRQPPAPSAVVPQPGAGGNGGGHPAEPPPAPPVAPPPPVAPAPPVTPAPPVPPPPPAPPLAPGFVRLAP
jgi:hypothetical protein